jgi:hypothetical protein
MSGGEAASFVDHEIRRDRASSGQVRGDMATPPVA